MTDKLTFTAQADFVRLDSFLAQQANLTRSHCQKLIANSGVSVNGKTAIKTSHTVKTGDIVEAVMPQNTPLDISPQNIGIEIVYQDDYLVVVNKPQGLTVHPANNCFSDTLVNALLFHIKDLSGINGVLRPGIVHRLDKDTSGLLVVAKNDFAHQALQKQIQNKSCRRKYAALVDGTVKEDTGVVDMPIARSKTDRKKMAVDGEGRSAVTHFTVISRFAGYTLMEFELKTGRTHQIRVHAKYLGHPVVGDKAYGFKNQKFNLNGQLLHAKELSFFHPKTGELMTLSANLPPYFQNVLSKLKEQQ